MSTATLNKYRLRNIINDLRTKMGAELLNNLKMTGYYIKVSATHNHIADRVIDRSTNHIKTVKTVEDMMMSLCNYYSCTLLHYAQKSLTEGMQNVVVYQKINGKFFAVPITVIMYDNADSKNITVTIRTVIPDYDKPILARSQKILVDYKPPKIEFEYDGYRRVMSWLDRLIASPKCPDALKVLR